MCSSTQHSIEQKIHGNYYYCYGGSDYSYDITMEMLTVLTSVLYLAADGMYSI